MKHQCQRQLLPHVICAVIKNQFSGGKEVPAPTACNLLLPLIYHPPSLGSLRMETSAEPFPCFKLSTAGSSHWLGLDPLPPPPPTIPPPQSQRVVSCPSLPVLGTGLLPEGGTCHFNGICVYMFIIGAVLVGAVPHVRGRKGENVCLSICLFARAVGHPSPPLRGLLLPQHLAGPAADPRLSSARQQSARKPLARAS